MDCVDLVRYYCQMTVILTLGLALHFMAGPRSLHCGCPWLHRYFRNWLWFGYYGPHTILLGGEQRLYTSAIVCGKWHSCRENRLVKIEKIDCVKKNLLLNGFWTSLLNLQPMKRDSRVVFTSIYFNCKISKNTFPDVHSNWLAPIQLSASKI